MKPINHTTPICLACDCETEPLRVLDEDENTSVLTNAGFCLSCDTIIVKGEGSVARVEKDQM